MNITPQFNSIPIPTVVNPQTENLRRENNQREVITQPQALAQSAAEKGVASERERARTPAQDNQAIDFENIRKQAEAATESIAENEDGQQDSPQDDNPSSEQEQSAQGNGSNPSGEELDPQEQADLEVIDELKLRDQEVRRHEQAHASAGGAYTGTPRYEFQIGPDGKRYAVGGEVSVDLSPISGDPRATIEKMRKVRSAALAPAEPSNQDRRVASSANNLILEAQSQLLEITRNDIEARLEANRNDEPESAFAIETKPDNEFDRVINETLSRQEQIAPSRSLDVEERAGRIQNFYGEITQAYEAPPKNNFQLSA